MSSHAIISKTRLLTMTNQTDILWGHTIEFDINSFTIIFLWVKHNTLNSDGQVEIYNLKRSVKHITLKITSKLLSHYKINYFGLIILFVCDTLLFLKLNRILSCELKKNSFVTFTYKLINNISFKIAIIKWEKESTRYISF